MDNIIKKISSFILILASLFHIYIALFGVFEAFRLRTIHLLFLLPLAFILHPSGKNKSDNSSKVNYIDIILFFAALFGLYYLSIYHYNNIINRVNYVDQLTLAEIFWGITIFITILIATKRVVGWGMVIIVFFAIAYTFLGQYLPRQIAHTGSSFIRFIEHETLTTEGIFSIPLSASVSFIFLFILFGAFLEQSGTGQFFIDLACALAGRTKGGPAKIAVLASAFMGSVSGSATANVTSTGVYTIPLMKKIGYSPSIAGGIEAAASTGGQILPPIMGAASFLLVEFVGISYSKLMLSAAIPAILYFISVALTVHFQAGKLGIERLEDSEIPNLKNILTQRGYLSIPLIMIVVTMIMGYTPNRAALWAIITVIIVSSFRKETRMSFGKILETLYIGARNSIPIVVTCAAAGIIIGVAGYTGIGAKFASMIIGLSGGKIYVILPLIMLTSIILGMGLPTSAAYIMVATIAVPALIDLNINILAANLFALYFGVFSAITPPVAITSYTAAALAKESPVKTSIEALKISLPAFIVPYLFIFQDGLLLQGSIVNIILAVILSLFAIVSLSIIVSGYFFMPVTIIERIFLILTVGLIISSYQYLIYIGIAFFIIIFLLQILRKSNYRNTK